MAYTGKKPVDHTDVTQSQSMTVTDDLTVDTNTLHVDSTNNRVGIGTSSPTEALDVAGTVTADGLTVDGNNAAIKVDQTASTNSAIQIGDPTTIANDTGIYMRTTGEGIFQIPSSGDFVFKDTNLNNLMKIGGNKDVSFYEDTGTTAKLFWDASAESLGIGTSSPMVINGTTFSSGNHLHHTSSTHARIVASGSSSGQLLLNDTGASTDQKTKFIISDGGSLQFGKTSDAGSNTEQMRLENDADLHVDGNVVAYSTTISDVRLKKDIAPIEDAVTKVQQLNGCTFTYLKDDRKSAGLIAQDVEKVLPSAVIDDEAVFHGEEGETYKTVQYDQLIGLLVEAVKELKAEIEELKDASSK